MAWYVLDGHEPKAVSSLEEWASKQGMDRHVAQNVVGEVRVSTVFLGLDHSHGFGPPLLFETMIFGGVHDGYQERCSTWDQAVKQHAEAMRLLSLTNGDGGEAT